MSRYGKSSDDSKYMSFLIKDVKLLEKYNNNWDKVSNSIKRQFDGEPVYDICHQYLSISNIS